MTPTQPKIYSNMTKKQTLPLSLFEEEGVQLQMDACTDR